jgi:hypothetical protein
MQVEWYGQSAFRLRADGKTVFIDPFGDMSEMAASRGMQFEYPPIEGVEAELLLVTHEHFDHNACGTSRRKRSERSSCCSSRSALVRRSEPPMRSRFPSASARAGSSRCTTARRGSASSRQPMSSSRRCGKSSGLTRRRSTPTSCVRIGRLSWFRQRRSGPGKLPASPNLPGRQPGSGEPIAVGANQVVIHR